MGLVKMKKLTLVGLQSQQDVLLSRLLEMGMLHVRTLDREKIFVSDEKNKMNFLSVLSTYFLSKTDEIGQVEQEYKKYGASLKQAIQLARDILQVKKTFFDQQRQLTFQEIETYSEWSKLLPILKNAQQLEKQSQEADKLRLEIAQTEHNLAYIMPWLGIKTIDVSSSNRKNNWVSVHTYRLAEDILQEKLAILLAEYNARLKAEQKDLDDEGQIYLQLSGSWVRFLHINTASMQKHFSSFMAMVKQHIQLEDLKLPAKIKNVEEYKEFLSSSLQSLRKELAENLSSIKTLALHLNEFENAADYLKLSLEKLSIQKEALETKRFIYIEAYIPEHLQTDLVFSLQNDFVVALKIQEVKKADEYPIGFVNRSLIRPYESITEMFSLPSANEIDPTPTFAPFYFLFYGIMFSDIGYGLLLSALTGFLLWGVKVRGSSQKLIKVLFGCGLSATFWGLLFGSFFGNLIDTVLGVGAFRPLWFNPMEKPLQMIAFAVFLGYLHLMMALAVKMYIAFAHNKWQEACFDTFPWIGILTGLHLLALEKAFLFNLYYIPQSLIIFSVALLLIFSGRPSYNPFIRLIKGLGALYGSTAYLSDLMSYTRILALNLATAVIAMVVNRLGSIAGFSFFGILLFIIVGILGHTLNFVLSALGAYVHTTRLQFVEFFSKFYEGGGVPYTPARLEGDYVEVKARKFSVQRPIKEFLKNRVKILNENKNQ